MDKKETLSKELKRAAGAAGKHVCHGDLELRAIDLRNRFLGIKNVYGNLTVTGPSMAGLNSYGWPKYDFLYPEGLEVRGDARLQYGTLQGGTHIHGDLDLTGNYNMWELPRDLKIAGNLNLTACGVTSVPWEVAEHIRAQGGKIIGVAERCIEKKPEETSPSADLRT